MNPIAQSHLITGSAAGVASGAVPAAMMAFAKDSSGDPTSIGFGVGGALGFLALGGAIGALVGWLQGRKLGEPA